MRNDILQIGISESDGTRVLRLTGELDSFTSERLANITNVRSRTARKLIVNLDALEYIDSAGLSTLVGIWVEMNNYGIQMVLSCNNPRIYRILEITGLLNFFSLDTGMESRTARDAAYIPKSRATDELISNSPAHAGMLHG